MDALAVRQSPSPDFYENLANLKGGAEAWVDL